MVGVEALSKIWMDGSLVPWDEAKVHVLSHGLHYGYAVFEGIRCHRTPRGSAVFRLDDHLDRFLQSALIYRMRLGYSRDDLHRATVELIRANRVDEAYIRPIAFSGYGHMGLDPTPARVQVAIAMWPWGPYLGKEAGRTGVRAMVSSWIRVDPRSMPPQAKCAANYANSALAKMEALAGGYDEAILLNGAGMVAEGPGENLFKVKKGVVGTPPANSGILRGVTRDTVIRLVAEEGLAFQRNDFSREELYSADEVFYTGTAAGITPIREIDGRPIGDGTFPITRRLQERYDAVIRGRSPEHEDWLTYAAGAAPARSPRRKAAPR